jgi:glycerate 2-kinase
MSSLGLRMPGRLPSRFHFPPARVYDLPIMADPSDDLRHIALAALASVEPEAITRSHLELDGTTLRVHAGDAGHSFDLTTFTSIFVIGFGKAARPMAHAVEGILGPRIDTGIIVVKPGALLQDSGTGRLLKRIRQLPGGHPVPDENSIFAAHEIASLADKADAATLVITLISGGGSSLIAAPVKTGNRGIELSDIQETTRLLLACGAPIGEMNCIRKHLLMHAGGRLAGRLAPAACVSLVLSDVVGDDLQSIASGPTCADESTYADARAIIDYYGIAEKLPPAVTAFLSDGAAGIVPETPKPGSPGVSPARTLLVGTNLQALHAARDEAERRGYHAVILSSRIAGESREVARVLAAVAKDFGAGGLAGKRPGCILAGGESTVTVRGTGKGGRNTEMAAAFLREMEREPRQFSGTHFLSFSTDGEDGPTDAAGGFANMRLVERARGQRLRIADALKNNDTYTLLKKLDGLFVTGPTGTNVCDIQVALVI